jgi:hypothetical protein
MAEIQAGTRFAAIAPSVDVERRSALVNTTALDYTIEDIAAAVSGDIDLTEYLTITDAEETYLTITDAEETYQAKNSKLIYGTTTQLSGVGFNGLTPTGLEIQAGDSNCGTFMLNKDNTVTWGANGSYIMSVNTTAILANFASVLNISIDLLGGRNSIITINNAFQAGGGFALYLKNVGDPITDFATVVVNWSVIK